MEDKGETNADAVEVETDLLQPDKEDATEVAVCRYDGVERSRERVGSTIFD
jgi:hypothetical protein